MFSTSMTALIMIIPFVYWVGILLYTVCSRIRCVRATCQRIWANIPCNHHEEEPGVEDVFPYRMVNDEEYTPLLGDTIPAVQVLNELSCNEPDSET